ncbi:citrate lyase beta subunit [Coniophora puteana RWD-64-598 SS2]|uniref:Citrate lyase beta subunit n=1 Tax=Coniophora puteana (strain RWD-64-598) TaxID=741705 RepID=A0A5M3MQ60_CONPW|nr:citrate lyase beta subunit [Coniophora puteana RWD-64-598 SS2]EIW81318.1 citrate lyase beta subunit [Coniophora puteana RWD-64-598 SS2]
MNSLFRTRTTSFIRPQPIFRRFQSTATDALRRSYLYVPASTDRMLDKSLTNNSDMLIYDLEDSVPPSRHDKESARQRLATFLSTTSKDKLPHPNRVAVRVNDLSTPFFQGDIAELLRLPAISTVILPKIHSAQDLHHVSRALSFAREGTSEPLRIVASIESARAAWNLGEISGWQSEYGSERGGQLDSLLFASEDYCADTSVIRTTSRQELLFVRSQIVVAAKAHRLGAIDMVCINYKDIDYLKDECEDGRKLGFTGKQAIHPTQVDIIQSTFVPTAKDILRAAKILHQMDISHSNQKGAFGLDMEGGGREMIDAPMLKQAESTIRLAKAAGLDIPDVSSQ